MAKIHVIGANGYVGALLVHYLVAAGHHVESAQYRLPDIPINSIDADIVIHLVASGGGSRHHLRPGWDDHQMMRHINIEGMKALMLAIKDPHTKVLFLSSSSVYGKFDDIPIVTERSTLSATSEYGKQKIEAEEILKKSPFEWMILRPCSIFGPSVEQREGNSFHNVIVDSAIRKGTLRLMGGEQKNDAVYIVDLISIIVRACGDEWHANATFNISGEITPVKDIITILADMVRNIGFGCTIEKVDHLIPPNVLIDDNKLRNAFPDWKKTPMEHALHTLVTNYLRHYPLENR